MVLMTKLWVGGYFSFCRLLSYVSKC